MNINDVQKDPLAFIEKSKKKDIIDLLKKADDAFFKSGSTLLTDDIYDLIKDYVRNKYPKDAYLKRVGADEDRKVTLPYYMGSQNKIRDDEIDIQRFQDKYKGPFIVSDKLDGVSCLITYNNDVKMYTRGNGTEGQDISHLLDYIQGIPKSIKNANLAVRGELIISKQNWEILKDNGVDGANARNVVSGCINSKIINKTIFAKIEFVAYSLLEPKLNGIDGMELLNTCGFKVVRYDVLTKLKMDILSNYLQRWRMQGEYVIDGIVICDNNIHNIIKGKNPDYSFAFKSIHTHEQVEVIVTGVEWNVSKDGYIKPIVKFNEVMLDDVKIKQATGFNAAFIEKHKIGAGSRIIIIRSGNVIPHILSVLTPSALGKPSMPEIKYIWNDTHVDIIMTDEYNSDYEIKNIIYFMKTLDIDYMGVGNITKLYNAGFNTIKKIINISYDELLKIEGFKEKSANNIIQSLNKIKNIDCISLMDASNMMGRGFSYKKIKMITDEYPYILKNDDKSREKALRLHVSDLIKVDGIAEISAKLFLENLPKFYEFYDDLGVKCVNSYIIDTIYNDIENSKVKGKTFVFSGFRNKDLEHYIEKHHGFVKTSVSKNTNYVVVADINEKSAKIAKANELGIKILTPKDEEYIKMFPSVI